MKNLSKFMFEPEHGTSVRHCAAISGTDSKYQCNSVWNELSIFPAPVQS
jgi:hypothetical protein